jgi:hypothetical protein
MLERAENPMPGSPLAPPLRVPLVAVSALLLVSAALACAQTAPRPALLRAPGQTPALAGAKEALMARAELLYTRAQPIPAKLAIEIPNVVTMNFALDTCSQEPDGVQ